ncbi:hypothetical protein O199_0225590 [Escherichia coli ATCC 35150]|nr:hypothetical protein O199_0225590 [Escherichia coli ATCC 35150]
MFRFLNKLLNNYLFFVRKRMIFWKRGQSDKALDRGENGDFGDLDNKKPTNLEPKWRG